MSNKNNNDDTFQIAILAGLMIYVAGLIVRVPTYDTLMHGIMFSLLIDSLIMIFFVPVGYIFYKAPFKNLTLLAFLMVIAVAIAMAALIVQIAYYISLMIPQFANPYHRGVLRSYSYFLLLYSMLGLAMFWFKGQRALQDSEVGVARAELAVSLAELKRLRSQLDPHFLFNVLNTVLVDVNRNQTRATRTLTELSGYLRYSLDNADIAFVPLSSEIAMVRSYLRIQTMRFGARLVTKLTATPDARLKMVPSFILQPLVENAVKYGTPDDDLVLRIDVSAVVEGNVLVINVENSGDMRVQTPAGGTGTGLANLKARLLLHYAERAEFKLEQTGENVRVTVRLTGDPC